MSLFLSPIGKPVAYSNNTILCSLLAAAPLLGSVFDRSKSANATAHPATDKAGKKKEKSKEASSLLFIFPAPPSDLPPPSHS
jgi:hypothetical protein